MTCSWATHGRGFAKTLGVITPHRSVGSQTMQTHFNVDVHNQDGAVIVSVSGELDLASSQVLETALERITPSDAPLVILDLRKLEFMDSTGLSVLVRGQQRAEDNGQRFGLAGGSQQVQRLLKLTGVADRLALAETPEALLNVG
jgi:anti-sigma B factor antagonist